MNKTYEIEYHIDGYVPIQREVITVDGRTARQNRLPICLIEYAQRTAKAYEAYRFYINAYVPPHLSGDKVKMGVAHKVYEEVMQ